MNQVHRIKSSTSQYPIRPSLASRAKTGDARARVLLTTGPYEGHSWSNRNKISSLMVLILIDNL